MAAAASVLPPASGDALGLGLAPAAVSPGDGLGFELSAEAVLLPVLGEGIGLLPAGGPIAAGDAAGFGFLFCMFLHA